ncbi:glycosyltransferase family 39 protein [Mycobacterium barrassiae]|uniref:ArnT family glycosyltransferase n=1 Tax=Mycobacterium barrassiae TaxID=319709 RepID=UPI002265DEE5|nr:glycosyltransferase family 39 protein [Mycobacterium barrassiae]MCV7301090.1 glycosyltransferase family 39 protein [Mycobacterium barrassiae]
MNRLRRLNPSIPVVAILLLLTAIPRLVNLTGSPTRLDDEGTYVAQAFAVSEWGELAHYTYWYDHPPAGWLQLAAWNMVVGNEFGGSAVVAGRYLMVLVAVLTATLLWMLGRRIGMSRLAVAAAVTIYAVSPLAISLSRSVYLDNLAIAWLLGALVLVCSPRHRLSAIFGAAACFGICVLTKETMMLLVPMLAWLVWIKTAPATRRYALTVFAAVFGVAVSTYLLMAVVRGELLPGPGHVSLWEGIKFQLWQREDSGALGDPQSLKRHTIDEWLALDPALPWLAAPIALTGLLIERIRPFAVGLLILVVTVVRPGYLPVPFVIAALPFIALLAAGIGEAGVARLRQRAEAPRPSAARYLRTAAVAATALVASVVVSLWLPSYHSVLVADNDASMRQAQQWITQNVPKPDRLIVDDALWVDLVDDGRDRRNVIWSYKVDTDQQVQNWAPRGWADYEWVVSTASMRANMPDEGVLTDAMSHARPVATFGSGGKRVDVLRVDTGSSSEPGAPALPSFGGQVAARLDAASNPDAVAALQSRTVDQRVVAALAVLSSTQPVVLDGFSAIDAERVAGTPQREFTLRGAPGQLQTFVAFFERQSEPFAVESAKIDGDKLRVRFPARATDVGLGEGQAAPAEGTAAVRVADVRRTVPADHIEFVRIDGGADGSVHAGPDPATYRTLPAGAYVMLTVGDRGAAPKMRQAFTVAPGGVYTLALFSAAESTDLAAQLAPDSAPGGPGVRLLHAAGVAGAVRLTLTPPGGEPTVLADNAQYGLITGYAPMPAGRYDATVTANGHEWRIPVEVADGGPTTLVLNDGQDGPLLHGMHDVPGAAAPLDPPNLTMPAAGAVPEKTPSQDVHADTWRGKMIPVVLCAVVIVGASVVFAKTRGRQR